MIAVAEKAHETRYRKLYENLESGKVFKAWDKIIWKCRNCGYLHEWDSAPEVCPACAHPQAYFEIASFNY
jgi:rubrerythrin